MTVRIKAAAVAAGLLLAATSACGSRGGSAIVQPNAVDIGFAQDMSVHHEQTVLMSQIALRNGTQEIRDLATSILSEQSQEIGAMRGWLLVWGQPPVDPSPMGWMGMTAATVAPMPSMPGMASMPGMSMPSAPADPNSMTSVLMPGMATPDQMLQLYNAHGKAFDILFCKLMIAHHLGGIQMAQAAVKDHAGSLVSNAAQQMVTGQYEEIGLLRAVLAVDGVKS